MYKKIVCALSFVFALVSTSSFAQTGIVKGKIQDSKGTPL